MYKRMPNETKKAITIKNPKNSALNFIKLDTEFYKIHYFKWRISRL